MKKLLLLPLLALIGCDSNAPPESCQSIDDQTVYVDERRVISICFSDPDMDQLEVKAESSDESIVTVTTQDLVLILVGRGVGEAVVMISATDSEGEVVQEIVNVTVPNRVPEILNDTITTVTLSDTETEASLDLALYFSDPDGGVLTYSVENLSIGLVSVVIEGSVITISRQEGLGKGSIIIIATDEGGLSVSGILLITVTGRGVILRDDFDTLSNWFGGTGAVLDIEDDRLSLRAPARNQGLAFPIGDLPTVDDWEIAINVENATSDAYGGLLIYTEDMEISQLHVFYGADATRGIIPGETERTNFIFGVRLGSDYYTESAWYGYFDEIDEAGTAQDFRIKAESNGYAVSVDGTEIIRIYLQPVAMTYFGLFTYNVATETVAADKNLFDWVELIGRPRDDDDKAKFQVPERLSLPSYIKVGTGAKSEVVEAKTLAVVPEAPIDLKAKPVSSSQIDLSWTPPEDDGGAPITRYQVQTPDESGEWVRLADVDRGTEYAHTEVTPGETWDYRVLARNEAGYGLPSNVASATTDDPVERTERVVNAILPRFASTVRLSGMAEAQTATGDNGQYRLPASGQHLPRWRSPAPLASGARSASRAKRRQCDAQPNEEWARCCGRTTAFL